MCRAIEYLTRLRDLSRKAAEAFDEDFPQQKSVYWRDFYAYDKAIDALMAAPQEPEASRINLGAFRDAVKAAMEKKEIEPEKIAPLCSEIIGALAGARIGRIIVDASTDPADKEEHDGT